MFCAKCGTELHTSNRYCPHCGAAQSSPGDQEYHPGFNPYTPGFEKPSPHSNDSLRTPGATMALAVLFGLFGGHAFYCGHTSIGIAKLTGFLFGMAGIASLYMDWKGLALAQFGVLIACVVWNFVDVVLILIGEYQDVDGKKIPKSD